jgi:hypothetical protein
LLLFGFATVALRHFRFFTPHSDLLSQLPYTETLDVILHQKVLNLSKCTVKQQLKKPTGLFTNAYKLAVSNQPIS